MFASCTPAASLKAIHVWLVLLSMQDPQNSRNKSNTRQANICQSSLLLSSSNESLSSCLLFWLCVSSPSEKTCLVALSSKSTVPWCSGTWGRGSASTTRTTRQVSHGPTLMDHFISEILNLKSDWSVTFLYPGNIPKGLIKSNRFFLRIIMESVETMTKF